MNDPVVRRRPLALLLLIALLGTFGVLSIWSVSSPAGSSPDDDFHLASIWCAQGDREGYCAPGSDAQTRTVPAAFEHITCFAFHPDVAADCQRPQIDQAGGGVVTGRGNFATPVYPGGFYLVLSTLVSDNLPLSSVLMRLFNSALFVLMVGATAWALPRRLRFPLVTGILVTIVPLGIFLIASTNPSSWTITSAAVVFSATIGYFTTHGRRRIILGSLAALGILIGVVARGDSSVYSVIALVAGAVIGFRGFRSNWRRLIIPAALALVCVALYLLSPQATVTAGGSAFSTHSPQASTGELIYRNLMDLPQLWAGLFGAGWGLGWLDTAVPASAWFPALLIFGAVLFAGLRVMSRRKVLATLALAAAFVLIPLYTLVINRVSVGTEVQPRYLFPLFLMLAVATLLPVKKESVSLSTGQRWVIILGLGLAQSLALRENLHRYVGSHGFQLDHGARWSPIGPLSPMTLWIVGSILGFAVLIALSLLAGRRRVRTGIAAETATLAPTLASRVVEGEAEGVHDHRAHAEQNAPDPVLAEETGGYQQRDR
ncbi:DUF2142 domain-containing protein [Mycetocola sp. JXN-3]|uniref:DUF2142 domain-containing protein n=1 Tax=Mycetocola sp. JXN-3 TaxID=2116510 RepID=UPI00165D1775|nr:DUF2142 domain-containing protein [Mycetocola sp. JXN-3]